MGRHLDEAREVIEVAHAEQLPDDVLDEVSKQIGEMMHGVIDPERLAKADPTTDKSPFEVWRLGADALLQPTPELRRSAGLTGRWHHQVFLDDVPQGFARSAPLGAQPSSWRVLGFFESKLAGKIAAAAAWIDDDKNVSGDPLVRLLEVPTYQVYAFWLLRDDGQDEVFVIDCPEVFTHLRPNQLLSQASFIDGLRREQHTVGRSRS